MVECGFLKLERLQRLSLQVCDKKKYKNETYVIFIFNTKKPLFATW